METLNHYEGENSMIKINPIIGGTYRLKRRKLRLIRRGALDLSQQDVADLLGVSKGTYGAWEQGMRNPSLENFLNLIKLFGNDIYEEIKTREAPSEEAEASVLSTIDKSGAATPPDEAEAEKEESA
jgi:transcriptional regulator with XRE-family HTH domain